MIKARITKFKISKLFGYQDIDIDFSERYKILIGENGLGKTTILNCLYYTLDKKFKKLSKISFESIELVFSNKNKVFFTKADLDFYVNKNNKTRGSQFYQILKDVLKKEDIEKLKKTLSDRKMPEQEKRFEIAEQVNSFNIKIKAPAKFIYDNVVQFIGELDSIKFQAVIEMLDKNINSKILYFPTYRRIESQLENLKNQVNTKNEYLNHFIEDENHFASESSEYDEVIKFGMDDVRIKIDTLTEEIRDKSLIGFSKITGDLLSQLSKEFSGYKFKNNVDRKKLQIILERVGNSISEVDKKLIGDYINSGSKTNKGLLFLIDKLIDLYNEQETLDLAIKNFADTCNKYLRLKKFRYDESSISLEIFRDNSQDRIQIEQLSSGEKQIVSLFSKIYLDLDKSFIILFDEPELSLSIFWQQKLLPDILASGKCNFLLSVTHSPFIYENEMAIHAYGLTDYIKFS